jgi:Zn-dependent protease with chaperone function
MTLPGTLTLLTYTLFLAAIAAWGVGLLVVVLLAGRKSEKHLAGSSSTWFLIGMSPLLGGLAVAGGCLTSAVLKGFSVIPDHCRLHPGHPHLCWTHADLVGPSGILLFGTVVLLGLVLASIWSVGRSLCLVRGTLRAYGIAIRHDEVTFDSHGVRAVTSELPAAFVAGLLKPRIYLTSAAIRLLGPEELRIVVTHEWEHIRRRDPLKLTLLRLTSRLFPGFRRIEERWRMAAELECDWACLEQGFHPTQISGTILKLARSVQSYSSRPVLAYAPGSEVVLRERVERLLSGVGPRNSGGYRWIFVVTLSALAACALSSMHHLLESVLGPLSG